MSLPIEGPMPLEKKRHEVTLFFADCKKKCMFGAPVSGPENGTKNGATTICNERNGPVFGTRKWSRKRDHFWLVFSISQKKNEP